MSPRHIRNNQKTEKSKMTAFPAGTLVDSTQIVFFDNKDAFPLSAEVRYASRYEDVILQTCKALFPEIIRRLSGSKPHKAEDALKIILLNIQKSRLNLQAIYYSRRKNDYFKKGPFNALPSYNSIKWIIDGLEELGLINHIKGFFGKRTGQESYYSRFCPSDKFCRLLDKIKFPFEIENPDDSQIKNLVMYRENDQKYSVSAYNRNATSSMKPVAVYNKYIGKHRLTVAIKGDMVFGVADIERLLSGFKTGKKTIITWEPSMILPGSTIGPNKDIIKIFNILMGGKNAPDIKLIRLLGVITRFLKFGLKSSTPQAFKLSDIGIGLIEYRINTLPLYRLFENKSLTLGGRFYQKMTIDSKALRQNYHMNGMEVAEPDFQAIWTNLAYNLKGFDYRNDPYIEPLGEDYRDAVKTAILYAFNCIDYKQALSAFRKKAREKNFNLPPVEQKYAEIFRQIEKTHHLISSDFYRQKWKELTFVESKIMGAILLQLCRLDIPSMPIHDGLVVPKNNLTIVKNIMSDEYEKVTGFKPTVK